MDYHSIMNEFREFYIRNADDKIQTFPIIAEVTNDKQIRYQILRSGGVEVVLSPKARELGLTGPGCISHSVANKGIAVAEYVRQDVGTSLIEFLQEVSQTEVVKIHKVERGAVKATKKSTSKTVPGTALLTLETDSETSVEVRVKKFAIEDLSKMFDYFVNHRIDSGIDFTPQAIEPYLDSAAKNGIVAKSKVRDRDKYLWHLTSPCVFQPIPKNPSLRKPHGIETKTPNGESSRNHQNPSNRDSLIDRLFEERIVSRLSKSPFSQVNKDQKNHGFRECLTWFAVDGHGQDDEGKHVDLSLGEVFWQQVAGFRTWCDKAPTDLDSINQLGFTGIEKNEDIIKLLAETESDFPECAKSFLRAVVLELPEESEGDKGKFENINQFLSTFATLVSISTPQKDEVVLDAWKDFLQSLSAQELAVMATSDVARMVWGMHLNGMDSVLDGSTIWNEFETRLSIEWPADSKLDSQVDREFNPGNASTVYSELLRDAANSSDKFKTRLQLLRKAIRHEVEWSRSTRWWVSLGLHTFTLVLKEIGTLSLATDSSIKFAVEEGLAEMISTIRTRSELANVLQLPPEVISQNGMVNLSDVMNFLGESDPLISKILETLVSRRVEDTRRLIQEEVESEILALASAKTTLESQVGVLSGRIKELGDESTAWKRRAEAFGNAENSDAAKIKFLETAAQLVRISLSVARREISDLEARQGFEARLIEELEEIGVRTIGAIGDEVMFDPEQHTSTRGEIVPDTTVTIVSPAFTRKSGKDEEVLLKAFVTSTQN